MIRRNAPPSTGVPHWVPVLAAEQAAFFFVTVQVLEPAELLVAVREGIFDSSSHAHLAGLPIRLTLALLAPDGGGAAGAGGPATRLYARLPPLYPMQPLQVEAVACAGLGRQWEDSCRGQLQLLADGSSGGGQELYPLVQALLEAVQEEEQRQLEQLAADGGRAPLAAGNASGSVSSNSERQQQQQHEVMLLRLHHMHDRSGYSKTIRRWALALGLTGRLLFCGTSSSPLILILLEGPAEGLRQYLVRQRTQNVDVDSKGRWGAGGCCTCGAAGCWPWLHGCARPWPCAVLCPGVPALFDPPDACVPACLPALVVQAVQRAHARCSVQPPSCRRLRRCKQHHDQQRPVCRL